MEMFPLFEFLQTNMHLHNKQMCELHFLIYTRIHDINEIKPVYALWQF